MDDGYLTITFPDDVPFAAADCRAFRGGLRFNRAAMIRVCEASSIDPSLILGNDDLCVAVLMLWYGHHISEGGRRDPGIDAMHFSGNGDVAIHEMNCRPADATIH